MQNVERSAVEKEGAFSISDFAELSRMTRGALLFYDRAGVLSPVSRKANGYRYYSQGQLALINMIRVFQELGMTLTEIRGHIDAREPENVKGIFGRQMVKIDAEIERWQQARRLLSTMQEIIHSVSGVDTEKITVQTLPRVAIVLGDVNDYSRGRNSYDALPDFYRHVSQKYPGMNLNYPVWGQFSPERIRNRDWKWPERYYFANPDGEDEKPAGLYAIGYTRGGYGGAGELYERLLAYIEENGLEVSGNTYEEYPLNELCVADSNAYLIRVMLGVRERK